MKVSTEEKDERPALVCVSSLAFDIWMMLESFIYYCVYYFPHAQYIDNAGTVCAAELLTWYVVPWVNPFKRYHWV